jgi:Spy/CpxP family protein refolding chaperone
MNARKTIVLSTLLALTLPAAGAAQRGPRGPFGPGGAGSPMERWLELRDELDLTADQVSRLEAIGARLREQNASHVAHMQEVREELGLPEFRPSERGARANGERKPRERMSEEDRARMRAFMDRTREDMEAVRSNTRDAMEEARDVLTDEQHDRLRETMRASMRARRGERGARGEHHPRGGSGAPGS